MDKISHYLLLWLL